MNKRLRESAPPHHVGHVLIPEPEIQARVDALVTEMADDCRSDDLVLIGILRGSFMFLADLVRDLYQHGIHPRIDFFSLSSYGSGTESSGQVAVHRELSVDVEGADVLLVDDILDTGRTLAFAVAYLRERGARRVSTCVLLDKPARRVVPFQADHTGFTIEDAFVVGYGLDYDSCYRELPYIARVTFADDQTPSPALP
jgi:hypoxanthine phosphoribosyltransferase